MIWYLYTPQNDHHKKSSFPLPPYKVTNMLYNITDHSHHAIRYNPMAYAMTESLYLGPLHPFCSPLQHRSPLAAIILFSVLRVCFMFVFLSRLHM